MAEKFKSIGDFFQNNIPESFFKDFSLLDFPFTLAVYNAETKNYQYLSKIELANFSKNEEIEVTKLFNDIDCCNQIDLKTPIKINKKSLVFTLIAYRRMLAYWHIFKTTEFQNYFNSFKMNEQRLRHHLLKRKWTPIETAHIINGLDPVVIGDINPSKLSTYGFYKAHSKLKSFARMMISVGHFDEMPEDSIVKNACNLNIKLYFLMLATKIWSNYDLFKTWDERLPLKIINEIFKQKLIPIDTNNLDSYDELLLTIINEIRRNNACHFQEDYPALDKFLMQRHQISGQQPSAIDYYKESTIDRNHRWQSHAEKINEAHPTWDKNAIASEIYENEKKLNPAFDLGEETIKRNIRFKKTRR